MSQSPFQLPPPAGVKPDFVMPEPPPFGWVGDTDHLTLDELDEIHLAAGKPLGSLRIQLMGYAAVAYARRLDPDKYPWEIAPLIPYQQITRSPLDSTEQDQAELAQAAEEAVEAGQMPPDPA